MDAYSSARFGGRQVVGEGVLPHLELSDGTTECLAVLAVLNGVFERDVDGHLSQQRRDEALPLEVGHDVDGAGEHAGPADERLANVGVRD